MELRRERATRVVTLGGGHGQANLLRAMRQLECEIRALVSVVDDGGCSGILRRTLGMPPPGDVRRCLCALAQEPELAEYFESRTPEGRSRGNLMMAELWSHSKNLQNVSDHMGRWLRVEGRIHPVSNSRCTIRAHDRDGNLVEGECEVSQADIDPLSVRVDSFGVANPAAVRAILDADIVLFGPGSLITSVLAAVLSPGIAEALEASTAKKVFIANVTLGSVANDSISAFSFVELLQQHLERRNG
ncbi:MAG: 2-phospho-L-lactate transferase CofD family protein, partial [Myxococcota bacterium]